MDFQKEMAGKALTVDVELPDLKISLINAGNEFSPNPAGNFMVNFDPSRLDDAAGGRFSARLTRVGRGRDRWSAAGRAGRA